MRSVSFDKEMFDRVEPIYWRACAENDFFGVLTREESARAFEYYHNKCIKVPDGVEAAPPTNERIKHKPAMWTQENWAWYEQCLSDVGIVEEPERQEVEEEDNDSGTITWAVEYVDNKAITHEKAN